MLAALLILGATELPKLAVMPLAANRIPAETAAVLDELLVNAISQRGTYKVVSASDINAVLGLEKMKDAIACDDTACASEIGGALGVSHLLAGSVNRLGAELIVSLKLIDIAKSEVQARAQITEKDDESLYRGAIERAVARLSGAPEPEAKPAAVSAPKPAELEKNPFVDREHWQAYVTYQRTTPDPLAPLDWAIRENQESTGLFIAELASLGAIVGGITYGIATDYSGRGAVNTMAAFLLASGVFTLPVLLIADALDPGTVEIQ